MNWDAEKVRREFRRNNRLGWWRWLRLFDFLRKKIKNTHKTKLMYMPPP